MARRNKKLMKLRQYRDKLIGDNVNLRTQIREGEMRFHAIRIALANDDSLRAYAITTNDEANEATPLEFVSKNEAVAELTLVYKMLAVERNYTQEMRRALQTQDLLRLSALCADHQAEEVAHDKMLSTWSVDHGFTRSLRDEKNDTIV